MMKNILVVDDDPEIRSVLGHLLEEAGFSVQLASDGGKAVLLLNKESFDLVITDVLMPGMDGIELSLYIRKHFPDLKIIAMSSGGDRYKNHLSALLENVKLISKAELALVKPLSNDKLLAHIESILA